MRAAIVVVVLGCLGLGGCVIYLNPLCNDQIQNGDETGIDCGGSSGCHKCDVGQGCRSDGDCDEANCVGGVCTPFPCDNGVQDNLETDVDCGGGTCRKCAGSRKCRVADDCYSGACDPTTMTCSALSVSFGDEQRQYSGFKPYIMFSTDLDGDGDLDLAVVNEYGSSVGVFLNNFSTGGGFTHLDSPAKPPDEQSAKNFGPVGAYPTGGAIVDFNHDGRPDIITADYHGNSVSVLLNAGGGMLDLSPVATYPTVAGAETSNLAVGDLNGDGNLDVAATNPQRASVSVFLSNSDGTLDPAVNLPVGVSGGAQPYSAVIADFNGDSKNDLAIADETSGTIIVRLGNGDGTFGPEVPYEIDGTRDYILLSHDMNLDGKPDLLCANRNGDTVSVLLGRGDGSFRKAIVVQVGPPDVKLMKDRPWFGPYSLAVADINQDGVPDIVTPNFLGDSFSVMLGIGDGHFDPAIEFKFGPAPPGGASMFTTPYGIVAADFDGDGKIDIATANAGSYDLLVKLNTGQKH